MTKYDDLKEWKFKKNIMDRNRAVTLKLHLKHPDIEQLIPLTPAQRNRKVNTQIIDIGNKLIKQFKFESYTWNKGDIHFHGLEVKTSLEVCKKLLKLKQIEYLFIENMEGAIRIKRKSTPKLEFYCVKMTVAIQVEKAKAGMQTWEERFVLVKAYSFDDAYDKVEKNAHNYLGPPHINSHGYLVRWKIESYDDCFHTFIDDIKELNSKEGVEVYSRLRLRKMTKERYWNGKVK